MGGRPTKPKSTVCPICQKDIVLKGWELEAVEDLGDSYLIKYRDKNHPHIAKQIARSKSHERDHYFYWFR